MPTESATMPVFHSGMAAIRIASMPTKCMLEMPSPMTTQPAIAPTTRMVARLTTNNATPDENTAASSDHQTVGMSY